jgi:hypothetical protein
MAKSKRNRRKGRSQNTRQSIPSERPLLIERLADAALIAAVFTILAFSEIRFEGFETEKAALIPIFGGIILASHITRFFRNRDILWKQVLFNPVMIGVIGIIITSTISSLLGFSPARSWIGEAERLSGLQTLLIYLLLFSQAVVSVERITPLLTPIIITISAPLCLSIFFSRFVQGVIRPGSTSGNPNYLSSWLVMAMLMLVILLFIRLRKSTGEWNWVLLPQLLFAPLIFPIPVICWTIYRRVKDVRYGWKSQDWMYLFLVLFMLVFMTATIVVVGSRAALLAYAIGGMTSVCIILAVARQRRLLIMFSSVVIVAGLAYVAVSNIIPQEIRSQGGIYRVLSLGDSRRQELWGGAISVIKQQDKPFYLADGTPDSLASVRPMIGYGLSVIPQVQGRFGATTHKNQFVGSFHNHIFDYIVMTGYPGMLFYVLFYLGAIAMTVRQLRLVRDDMFQWLMLIMAFGLVGVLVTPSLFPGAAFLNIVPIGISLGVLGGNFVWIAGQAFRRSDYFKPKNEYYLTPDVIETEDPPIMTDRQIMLAGLLGAIILRWVDIQFAFVQAASEPLFWTLAGLFLGHYYKLWDSSDDHEQDKDVIHEARPIDWQMGVLATGIMIFYGFGITVSSNVYNHSIGLDRMPWFILILVICGYMGAVVGSRISQIKQQFSWGLAALTPMIWSFMWSVKSTMSTTAGDTFDNTIRANVMSESGIITTFFYLSLTGIVMAILLLIFWALYDNWRVKVAYPLGVGGAIFLAVLGGMYYSTDYITATSHAVGIGFMEEGTRDKDEKVLRISEAAYKVATDLDPSNARTRIHMIGMIIQYKAIIQDSRPNFDDELSQNVDLLLQYEPYFIHALEWQQFSGFHERVFGRPLRAISRTATDY